MFTSPVFRRGSLVLTLTCSLAACGEDRGLPTQKPYPTSLVDDLVPATSIHAAKYASCAVTEGGVVQCWGISGQPSIVRIQEPVVTMAMSAEHACAATHSGAVWCWGDNSHGQLGDGSTAASSKPVRVNGLTAPVVSLAASGVHTCALAADASVRCWGKSALPNGSQPVEVLPAGSGAVEIAASDADVSLCVRKESGFVDCWPDYTGLPSEVIGLPRAVSLSMHGSKRCILDEVGSVWGWGGWQLDNASGGGPVQLVSRHEGRQAMAMGSEHACIVSGGGLAECFGENRSGQLGTWDEKEPATASTVVAVKGINVAAIATGDSHTCTLTRTGSILCFGAGGGGLGATPRLVQLLDP